MSFLSKRVLTFFLLNNHFSRGARIFLAKVRNLFLKSNRRKLRGYIFNLHRKNVKTIVKDLMVYFSNPTRNTLNLGSLNFNNFSLDESASVEPISNISIIVPIFNSFEMVEILTNQLLASEPLAELILVDDCSDELLMYMKLTELSKKSSRIKLIKTPSNLGFTGSVNYAITFAKEENNILLLNSDTQVPKLFASRMAQILSSGLMVASVTPLSNSAEIASAPLIGVDCPTISPEIALQLDEIARYCALFINSNSWPTMPTGVGFCMLFSRKVINEIGMFNEEKYPRGYGEENDWSLRARDLGYQNYLCPSVYVWHSHGASFGVEKELLQLRHSQQLDTDYPEFKSLVREFFLSDPLQQYRYELYLVYLLKKENIKLTIVFDTATSGGARKHLQEETLSHSDHVYILIRPVSENEVYMIITHASIELKLHGNWEDLEKFCNKFQNKSLLINSVAFAQSISTISFIQKIQKLCIESEIVESRFIVHDFHSICPSINLMNSFGKYCDLPNANICNECLPRNVYSIEKKSINILDWRTEWTKLFSNLSRLTFPSDFAKSEFLRVYPNLEAKCIVLEPKTNALSPLNDFNKNQRMKHIDILVLGNINYAKGSGMLKSLSQALDKSNSNLYLRHFGLIDIPIQSKHYVNYGPYSTLEEIEERCSEFNFQAAVFPSICPETYSYVCDELNGMKIPVVAFKIGAPYSRYRFQKNFHFIEVPKDGEIFAEAIKSVMDGETL